MALVKTFLIFLFLAVSVHKPIVVLGQDGPEATVKQEDGPEATEKQEEGPEATDNQEEGPEVTNKQEDGPEPTDGQEPDNKKEEEVEQCSNDPDNPPVGMKHDFQEGGVKSKDTVVT